MALEGTTGLEYLGTALIAVGLLCVLFGLLLEEWGWVGDLCRNGFVVGGMGLFILGAVMVVG